jgi:hypothetical protein
MNQQLTNLVQQAISDAHQYAELLINDKWVSVRVTHQSRRTTARRSQQPCLMWKVAGKRVSAKNLMEAI